MKRSLRKLGVVQRQQRFKVADHFRREPPLARLVSVRQSLLNRVFGNLELLDRLSILTVVCYCDDCQ
ncbi:hypothetical protein P3T23_008750 [Paraburkholderia sp. GAS448]|uniref:hypothetical protein n=1 Tax=Paraburkholderia sp. GAS448 TaxID=3035136 RepID=UPI003D1D7ACB